MKECLKVFEYSLRVCNSSNRIFQTSASIYTPRIRVWTRHGNATVGGQFWKFQLLLWLRTLGRSSGWYSCFCTWIVTWPLNLGDFWSGECFMLELVKPVDQSQRESTDPLTVVSSDSELRGKYMVFRVSCFWTSEFPLFSFWIFRVFYTIRTSEPSVFLGYQNFWTFRASSDWVHIRVCVTSELLKLFHCSYRTWWMRKRFLGRSLYIVLLICVGLSWGQSL